MVSWDVSEHVVLDRRRWQRSSLDQFQISPKQSVLLVIAGLPYMCLCEHHHACRVRFPAQRTDTCTKGRPGVLVAAIVVSQESILSCKPHPILTELIYGIDSGHRLS